MDSLGSFSADSDTSKGRVKRKTDRVNAQNGDRDTTVAQKGQRLDQSALKVLEANTSGSGGIDVSEFLQYVEGRRSKTLQAMEQAVQLHKTQLGEDHPDTLTSMHNLAVRYSEVGRQSETLQLTEQVVQLHKTQLGEDHPDTLTSMHNLAVWYSEVGRQSEALQLMEQVVQLRKTQLGEDHPDTIGSMHNLAVRYNEVGRQSEALQLTEQVVQLYQTQLGMGHPNTLGSMHNLAVRYSEAGRPSEALELTEQVVSLRKTLLGKDHPDTIGSMHNLAIYYDEVERRSEALELMEELVQLRKSWLGEDHPDTLASMHNLANRYSEVGRESEALQLLVQVEQLDKTPLGEDHPGTLTNNLLRPDDFDVGWICASQTEYVVARELLDEEYPELLVSSAHDKNTYSFGRMGQHNIVIACPPRSKYSLTSAASVAKDMLYSFPSIRFGLMVGIAGGAPSEEHDIRLGDVVIGSPIGRMGRVIYYEFGDIIQNYGLEQTAALAVPPSVLVTASSMIRARHARKGHRITETVRGIVDENPRLRRKYSRPEADMDRLYESTFVHPHHEQSCKKVCEKETARIIQRYERDTDEDDPVIHYGLIASVDEVIKDAQIRDTLARDEGVLCFKKGAAGLLVNFPCVVVCGICDYSDTHKNDIWQGYAAATAAAYAKELLEVIEPREVGRLPQHESFSAD